MKIGGPIEAFVVRERPVANVSPFHRFSSVESTVQRVIPHNAIHASMGPPIFIGGKHIG